jgi:hypothetical protein
VNDWGSRSTRTCFVIAPPLALRSRIRRIASRLLGHRSPEGQKTDSHRAEIEAGLIPDKIGYQQ